MSNGGLRAIVSAGAGLSFEDGRFVQKRRAALLSKRRHGDHKHRLSTLLATMTSEPETPAVPHQKPAKKLKPARKQVKPGDVEKKETPQTGKEYSASCLAFYPTMR